jgi:shikimate dehydrogenase
MFVPLQVAPEHLAAVVGGMRYLRDFSGFAVTMPHKEAVARLCDSLLPNAKASGVVNAVRIEPGGRLVGETFDGIGMVEAIQAHRAIDGSTRVLIAGAGGVGKAIAVALALAGVGYLTITNRTQAKAEALADTVRKVAPACTALASAAAQADGFDVVINATSLGTNGEMPIDVSRVSPATLVAEVVAAPEHTPLLQAAQARGLGIVRGLEMMTPQIAMVTDFFGITAPSRPSVR